MMKVIIFCDGGLGNRMGSMIGGLYLADKLNAEFEIAWPQTDWCYCSYGDLFENEFKNSETNFGDVFKNNKIDLLVSHIQLDEGKDIDYCDPENMEQFNFKHQTIVYNNSLVPSFLTDEKIVELLWRFKINKGILDSVNDYILKNSISVSTIGLHIRKTDNPLQIDDNFYSNTVMANPAKKFFICSDDESVENKFGRMRNTIIRKKNHYVRKIDESSEWFKGNNVFRSKESVIEGFIDMLVLSRTTIVSRINNTSTFLKFAIWYNKIVL